MIMARPQSKQHIVPSLIDRLLAPPTMRRDWSSASHQFEELKRSLRRDLQDLLNTRCPYDDQDFEDAQELRYSLLSYGVPDFTGLHIGSKETQLEIERKIESIIKLHETRLSSITVHLDQSSQARDRVMRFQIQAKLAVRPDQQVTFTSDLETTTGSFEIHGAI